MFVDDPLDEAALNRELVRPGSLWRQIHVVEETGSTNADLAGLARAGEPAGQVLITNFQSAGRGRQGRTWSAPPGTSIALSLLVRPVDAAATRWTWLPLLAGLAVVEGLSRAVDVLAVLKWPNDVLVVGRKICGVLAERVETPTGPACVIGIGLNVALTEEQLPVPTASSLALVRPGQVPARQPLIAAILAEFATIFRRWEGGDDTISARYADQCDTIGRAVRVMLADDRIVEGQAQGIDADGRLLVQTSAGVEVFGAGDVVHLR